MSSLNEGGETNDGFSRGEEDVDVVRRYVDKTTDGVMMNDLSNGRDLAREKEAEAEAARVAIEVEVEEPAPILYKINDSPPIYLTIFFAFQQMLLSIAGSIIAPLLVAEAACALEDGTLIRKLVSTTMIMNGMTTLLQNLVGVRLPVFQGPSGSYAVPVIALNKIDKTRCDVHHFHREMYGADFNTSISNATLEEELIDVRIREMMGPLILVGVIHCLIGATGLVGVMLRFVGPITIVPTILLIGLYIVKPAMVYTEAHWGIAAMTWIIGLILSLYLGHKPMPIPIWTIKKGFRIIRYPLHQVFAILISILVGWGVCGILTSAGYFTNDRTDKQFKARTDARAETLEKSDWFYLPYPGQFGTPLFSVSCLVGFFIATITSILDSIGDYYATAAMCRVPPPPRHAVNRGIAVEGLCSALSGVWGTGHATTTYGGNIGAIGMTKVASRSVFLVVAVMYLVFGVLAKVMAVFISIPYPVLGGGIITIIGVFVGVNLSNLRVVASRSVFLVVAVMYLVFGVLAKVMAVFISIPYPVLGGGIITIIGVFVGVNLSNLRVVDLSSTRNLSIIGMAVFVGLLVPSWMEDNGDAIDTGNRTVDQVLLMLLGNPNFVGCFLACFLDNTVPGTDEERGIAAWQIEETPVGEEVKAPAGKYLEGPEVYTVNLPRWLRRRRCLRYIPMCQKY